MSILWVIVLQLLTSLLLFSVFRFSDEDFNTYKFSDWFVIFFLSFIFPLGIVVSIIQANECGWLKSKFGFLLKEL